MPNWPTQPTPPYGPTHVYTMLQYNIYSRDPADTAALRTTYGGPTVRMRPAGNGAVSATPGSVTDRFPFRRRRT